MPTSTCWTCHLHGLYISNFTVVVLAEMLDLLSGNGCMTEYSGRHTEADDTGPFVGECTDFSELQVCVCVFEFL